MRRSYDRTGVLQMKDVEEDEEGCESFGGPHMMVEEFPSFSQQ
jgi:hypothetical protein